MKESDKNQKDPGPSKEKMEEIKACLAPCGLSCEACFAHVDGAIRDHSIKLKEKLGNFDIYARRFETLVGDPVFKKYPQFKEMLDYFSSANCTGCRSEQCKLFKDCGVRPCHQEKGVDFCFQCDAFPCDQTHFDEHLHERWVRLNEIIRKSGIEAFYEKSRTRPRYV
ncbi:DUF3795 domain-containing protein [Desulfospira joergensenii]|uniref:DUF3795 domain-containing protein n=1 Tax=Desulfospira joergensenii TaxID=53329 RepID=UPI0003B48808|nr:DUF3795 domain-containing protein [Desulfospira joergensenii]